MCEIVATQIAGHGHLNILIKQHDGHQLYTSSGEQSTLSATASCGSSTHSTTGINSTDTRNDIGNLQGDEPGRLRLINRTLRAYNFCNP